MLRVCAVQFLNTSPLVWGMLHGAQRGLFDLSFEIPSRCADAVRSGAANIGIVPSIELERQDLAIVPGLGIASCGPVRSILLISKVPAAEIRTLAADTSSRTSVVLARVILEKQHGVRPQILPHAPELAGMLKIADAALVIGDPALRIDPETAGFVVYDLGTEWTRMTALPMVFAVWAGPNRNVAAEVAEHFQSSYQYGRDHIDDILRLEAVPRGFPLDLARHYLTENIVYELTPRAYEGMALFRKLGRSMT